MTNPGQLAEPLCDPDGDHLRLPLSFRLSLCLCVSVVNFFSSLLSFSRDGEHGSRRLETKEPGIRFECRARKSADTLTGTICWLPGPVVLPPIWRQERDVASN